MSETRAHELGHFPHTERCDCSPPAEHRTPNDSSPPAEMPRAVIAAPPCVACPTCSKILVATPGAMPIVGVARHPGAKCAARKAMVATTGAKVVALVPVLLKRTPNAATNPRTPQLVLAVQVHAGDTRPNTLWQLRQLRGWGTRPGIENECTTDMPTCAKTYTHRVVTYLHIPYTRRTPTHTLHTQRGWCET